MLKIWKSVINGRIFDLSKTKTMTTYSALQIEGNLKASNVYASKTIFAGIEKETEKAIYVGFIIDGEIAVTYSWIPKSCITVGENLTVKSWFFEKEITNKLRYRN